MKIGIGVITYNRPEHFNLFKDMLYKSLTREDHINTYVYYAIDTDQDRKGVAYRSNECLRALKGCDFVFLFNDDCFPIAPGWAEFFIEAHRMFGNQHHFLYMVETPTIKKISHETRADDFHLQTINVYNNCAGCFMFLTKEVIEKVGAFNEEFGLYGFEHAEYSKRVHLAGLTPMGEYLCPAGADKYIYSLDLQNNLPFNKQVKHKSSMSATEAMGHIMKAQPIFDQPIIKIHRPL